MDVRTHNFGTYTSERETAYLLSDMGLTCVALNWKMIGANNNSEGEIDGVFYDEINQLYIIYDDSTQREGRQEKIAKFLNKWKEPINQEYLRSNLQLKNYPIYIIYIDKSGKDTKVPSVNYTLDPFTKIVYTDDYNYFTDIFNKIGKWARNDFFNYLDIKPRNTTKQKIHAMQIYVGNTPAYVFADRVENILSYCYISRRRDNSVGYQRMVDEKRVRKLEKAINNGTINSFPNSILLNCIDDFDFVPKPKSECPCHVQIDLPNSFSSCRVVDGQHRLLAFSKLESRIQDSHSLAIVLFHQMPIENEIQTFIQINDNQKGIDPNLIYSLKAEMSFQTGTKESLEKVSVDIAKELNFQVPFFKSNVFFGNAGEEKKRKITLTAIVEALIAFKIVDYGNGVLQKTEQDIQTAVNVINNICTIFATQDIANLAFYKSNNGVKIILQFTSLLLRNIEKGNISVSIEDGVKKFITIISRNKSNLASQYGDAGFNALSKLLLKDLKTTLPEFKSFETDFKKLK